MVICEGKSKSLEVSLGICLCFIYLNWDLKFLQVKPPEVFCKKRCSQNFRKIHRKTTVPVACNIILKKRLWHRCFPVNFAKFLRTPLLQNTSGWLLLLAWLKLTLGKLTVFGFFQLMQSYCLTNRKTTSLVFMICGYYKGHFWSLLNLFTKMIQLSFKTELNSFAQNC